MNEAYQFKNNKRNTNNPVFFLLSIKWKLLHYDVNICIFTIELKNHDCNILSREIQSIFFFFFLGMVKYIADSTDTIF